MSTTTATMREGPLARRTEILLPAAERPILVVVVDTEEEFDWSAPFRRDAVAVTAMREIGVFQRLCEEFGIAPAYVADYPVVSNPDGAASLRELHASGRAEIGAHLHPWVTPPFDELVCARNSYPGNLEPGLEAEKLRVLTETIEERTGARPRTYKAGRYGFGPNTPEALEGQGYEVDLSPSPPFDYGADGGPDYSAWGAHPYWFGGARKLLGLPNTGAFVGFLGRRSPAVWRLATRPALRWARLPGILSRLDAVSRLRLSPEGHGPDDLMRLTRALLRAGVRVFSFSLHSPSLKPGCTSYVRSAADLATLLGSCRRYFDRFLGELGGISMTPTRLAQHLRRLSPPDPS
jgi:hypothetical protein